MRALYSNFGLPPWVYGSTFSARKQGFRIGKSLVDLVVRLAENEGVY